ncbi:MAG: C25 family cysteine peptidase [candidate division NC10 bacterium]|nr:C25 family cysteine peptidase [candidate division NC10 bacterium]
MRRRVVSTVKRWAWGLIGTLGLALALPGLVGAQYVCTFPAGGTPAAVLNTYYPGTGNPAAGQNYINLTYGSPRGAANAIQAGDLLLIIQMQGVNITTTNSTAYGGNNGTGTGYTNDANFVAGQYEYVVANAGNNTAFGTCTAANNKICITGAGTGNGLINAYRTNASGAQGRDTFQVIRVAQYGTLTLSGTAGVATPLALPWDGTTGGVLAVDVSGTLTLSGTISLDGLGFRGGGGRALAGSGTAQTTDYRRVSTVAAHGAKGEGIAGTPAYIYDGTAVVATGSEGWTTGSQARGAPANAGGGGTDGNPTANDQNTGGGGGGNGGAGGTGGNSWSSNLALGGLGGVALPAAANRIFMGGGGGAGSRNNSVDPQSSGGLGGGIVLLRAGSLAGTGTITANGTTPPAPDNDGGGGGGAGGTILIVTATGNLSGLTVQAKGGKGSDAWRNQPPNLADRHGPGGGGGGGVTILSGTPASSDVSGGAPGVTTQLLDTYGATGQAGVNLGIAASATINDTPGVQTCLSVTRASIRGLRVNPDSVEFATGQRRRTLGFNLYALKSPTRQADRRRLNDRLVAAPVPDSVKPILYRVETGPVAEPYLLIEEIEVGGRIRTMGPFEVGDGVLRRAFEVVASRVLSGELHETPGARMASPHRTDAEVSRGRTSARAFAMPGRAAQGIKIEVDGPGHVVVPLSELVAAGLPGQWAAAPRQLHLTNLGQPAQFEVVRAPQGQPSGIAFDAEELSTDYTGHNVYVLRWTDGAPRLDVSLTRSGFPREAGFTRVERNLLWAPFLTWKADPWIWDILSTGMMGPVIESFDLAGLPARLHGEVPVRVGLVGATNHTHRVWATLNGLPLGEVSFKGETMAWVSGHFPAAALRPTGNELTLTYEADLASTEDVGLVCLDVLDIGIRPVLGGAGYELSGFDTSMPSFEGKNYLIVTHELFRRQAERIAELKSAEGLRPVVVDVERAYDRFAAGVFEAQAVRELIRQVAQRTKLAHVLLVGGDTFDPRGFSDETTGIAHVSYVPSLTGWDGEFGRVPSENRYADLDGNGRPDVAIGRLPVQTTDQADALVDKIARQREVLRATLRTHLVAVDKQGAGDISFRAEAEETVALLGPVVWADLSDGVGQAQQILMDGLVKGHVATHYFGHGGWDQWSNESVLTVQDAESLAGTGHGTVVFAWSCNSQWYLNDTGPSVNEALLLAPNGGAVASIGPTGETDPALQMQFAALLYPKILSGLTLGEALRQAKAEALQANPQMQPVVEGWSLLGDPSLRLPLTPQR